ncbi:ABC-three component system middle component 6 [Leptospira meyeri]|nr:ABC-three component system middle component 6 [Leptospira meyeri]
MPSKVIKPKDSLVNIGHSIIQILITEPRSIDELLEILQNESLSIDLEKLYLTLNFLFQIDLIEIEDETQKIILKQPQI